MANSQSKFRRIRARIAEVDTAVAALKQELQDLEREEAASSVAVERETPGARGTTELRANYDRLYTEFLAVGPEVVRRFVEANDESLLVEFCRANDLAIGPSPLSKSRAAVRITRGMAERRGKEKRG